MNEHGTKTILCTLLIVLTVGAGPATATQVSTTTITDSGPTAPIQGSTQDVLQFTITSDDAVVNTHDGAIDATAGSPTGVFGSTAAFFDADGNGSYDHGDEVINDVGGNGTYSESNDTVIAGTTPIGGAVLTETNPWVTIKFADNPSGTADGSWGSTTDVIVTDDDADGNYTSEKDTVLGGSTPTAGTPLADGKDTDWGDIDHADAVSGNAWDPALDTILEDLDKDDIWTSSADRVVASTGTADSDPYRGSDASGTAGSALRAFTNSTATNGVWWYDNDNSGTVNSNDAIWIEGSISDTDDTSDSTDDGEFDTETNTGDILVMGLAPFDDTVATEEIVTGVSTNTPHLVWQENGSSTGFDLRDGIIAESVANQLTLSTSADVKIAGTSLTEGDTLMTGAFPADWSNVSSFDETDADVWNSTTDAIILDNYDRGTYSASADTTVAGTPPSADAALTGLNPWSSVEFTDDPSGTEDGTWESSTDAIVTDDDGDGVYTGRPDVFVNAGSDGAISVANGQSLVDLDESVYGYVDLDASGTPTVGDEVYTEGDGGVLGSADYGEDLDAVTVVNEGTLSASNVSAVTLHTGESQVATANRTGGQWVFSGIARDVVETTFTVKATLGADIPEERTLHFAVPTVSDNGTANAYDDGDAGLFFQQAPVIGNISNGATITVDAARAVTANATSFTDPAEGNRTKVELAFNAELDTTSTDASDFTVRDTDGTTVSIAEMDVDESGRLVLDLGTNASAIDVASVELAEGAVETTDGGNVAGQSMIVETSSVTLREQDGASANAFVGERVALVADAGGNHNESVHVEADTDGDGIYETSVFDGTTGANSTVHVLETAVWNASDAFRVTFRSADGMAGETVTLQLADLGLTATAVDTEITTETDLSVTVATAANASASDRQVTATLFDSAGNTITTIATRLDADGAATITFGPQAAGGYTVDVVDRGSNARATAGPITVTEPATTESTTLATSGSTDDTTSGTDEQDEDTESDVSDGSEDNGETNETASGDSLEAEQTTAQPTTTMTTTSTTTLSTTTEHHSTTESISGEPDSDSRGDRTTPTTTTSATDTTSLDFGWLVTAITFAGVAFLAVRRN